MPVWYRFRNKDNEVVQELQAECFSHLHAELPAAVEKKATRVELDFTKGKYGAQREDITLQEYHYTFLDNLQHWFKFPELCLCWTSKSAQFSIIGLTPFEVFVHLRLVCHIQEEEVNLSHKCSKGLDYFNTFLKNHTSDRHVVFYGHNKSLRYSPNLVEWPKQKVGDSINQGLDYGNNYHPVCNWMVGKLIKTNMEVKDVQESVVVVG